MREVESIVRQSILTTSIGDRNPDLSVTPVGASARFSLRLPYNQAEKLVKAGGMQLDMPINTCKLAGERMSARLGPDEWLLIGPEADNVSLGREVVGELAGSFFSLVDIGHRNVAIQIDGPHAAEIINGGCALDLDDAHFPGGAATRTLFGKAEIVLIRANVERTYRVECWRSFAPYVYGLLKDVAREFCLGEPVRPPR
jgi:sarcosine oxidase, subunit gamma